MATVAWSEADCFDFIDRVCGYEERIPARYEIYTGSIEINNRLRARYGVQSQHRYEELFRQHLENLQGTSAADRTLWRSWRAGYAISGSLGSVPPSKTRELRVMSWDSGDDDRSEPVRQGNKSRPLFTAEGEEAVWERNVVDAANGSVMAGSLLASPSKAERTVKRLLGPKHPEPSPALGKHLKQQCPWEKKEYLVGNKATKKVLGKFTGGSL